LDFFQSTAGRITDGASGRNGQGSFDWTGWAARFVDDGVSRSRSPAADIGQGFLTLKGLSTVGATKGFNVSAYQTLIGQSYQLGIYTLTTSVRALHLTNATAIQSTGIGIGFLSGS